ncbi:MAG: hypothetical protein ACFFKA_17480 [Candidatus Thorarchaeota archaeon]
MPSQANEKNKKNLGFMGLTMREFQVFLTILQYEGESVSFYKNLIDAKFNHESKTKGYDYISILVKNKYARKEGKLIFINDDIRKQYEKLIIPTLGNVKESIKTYVDETKEETRDIEKIREKFSNYTNELKFNIIEILKDSPINKRENRYLQKRILSEFENSLKVELVKYQLFSE